ncbi:VOC family protein [Catelliglobosispora koreensis]|uniref:VOC family protein n=1 Tax=Catelliglobosispora koreensis TaxID=129052 RepID=UPI00035CA1DB|nr:VOC family protein [Catelliglobosispora koreensis]
MTVISSDPGARDFYTNLFGWPAHVSPEPEAMGYTLFHKDGKAAAAAGPLMNQAMPVAWMTQVSVTDVDEAAAKIAKAGGQVIVAPMDVFTQGRFAVVTDQTGAPFGLWQPRDMSGADIFNVDGAYTWSELTTRDPLGAKEFYREVFGWEAHDRENGPVTYTTFKVDGAPRPA